MLYYSTVLREKIKKKRTTKKHQYPAAGVSVCASGPGARHFTAVKISSGKHHHRETSCIPRKNVNSPKHFLSVKTQI